MPATDGIEGTHWKGGRKTIVFLVFDHSFQNSCDFMSLVDREDKVRNAKIYSAIYLSL